MSVGSWFKALFKGEKKERPQIKPIPVFKIETPEKIVETKIQPVKIPTIVDIGERLGRICRDLSILKEEMVSKSWFKFEYEDTGELVLNKLDKVNTKMDMLIESFSGFNNEFKTLLKKLSNFTKNTVKPELSKVILNTPDQVYNIIKREGKIRYKEIARMVSVTDPTLSKYLKKLVAAKKIKRTKIGKAVYYEVLS
jgi:Fic family protein